jgi:Ni,Fe-hydrogenase III large subunit
VIVRNIVTATEGLENTVKTEALSGAGIACMYVVEASERTPRSLETIMVSAGEVLRISSPLPESAYPSLTPAFEVAGIYEREISEMSGVLPLGHPDMRPLKMRTRATGSYPMQKTEEDEQVIRHPVIIPRNRMFGDGLFEIPVGPIHAGVIEPGHFKFSVTGEHILMLRVYLGYKFRGIEKMMETPVGRDNTRLAERISGDNGIAHSLAYLQAIEHDTEIPMRAKYVRTIYAELERIYYSLTGISGIALDASLSVPAKKGFALKEEVLRLNENVSGHRMLRNTLMPGGLRTDMSNSSMDGIRNKVTRLRTDVDELFEVLASSPTFRDRADTTGTLSKEDAVRLGTVGPVARASGIDRDVRKDHPYAAYASIRMRTVTHTSGDVFARLEVRKDELLESVNIITQCLNSMEPGDISCPVETNDGFHIGMSESPRGEVIHCVHVEDGNIWRYKIRDPSFPNWPAIESAVLGNIVPDFPLVNKSFDLSYSGNDL